VIYRQVFLTFMASKSLKLSFANCVLKRANNDFKLTVARFAFDVRQKFEAVPRE